MHEYDTVLKSLLQSSQNTIFERITGARIDHWLNVEFSEVQQTRVDILGVTIENALVGLEMQSAHDGRLPLRMAEYALRTYRLHRAFPRQYVLYVGEDDRPETVRRIPARIAKLETGRRDDALKKLMILSGLRKLEDQIRGEVNRMPILNDIMDHKVLGPAILQGRQEGRKEGLQQGERTILSRLLAKRFGDLPAWIEERLASSSTSELEDLSLRILDAKGIEDLFRR